MATPQALQETAQAGAGSVFRYVERTAEEVPDGVRWQTRDYDHGEPIRHVCLYNGAAGISIFLADYCAATGSARARDLALAAARWSAAPQRSDAEAGPQVGPGMAWSLLFGRSGVGLALLRVGTALEEAGLVAQAAAIGDQVAAAETGPFAPILSGSAGEGLFLVRLHEATGAPGHLTGAVRRAQRLDRIATRDELGCYWPRRVHETPPPAGVAYRGGNPPLRSTGFAPGAAGIGYLLLALFEATRDGRWATLAREAADTVARQAIPSAPEGRGRTWPNGFGQREPGRCQWCRGASGIGLFFAKAHEVLGDSPYLATAQAAGEATYAAGDVRQNPSQCHGLAGNAELFLELYRITQDQVWLERAHDFARRILGYRTIGPDGDVWQADEPGTSSPDLMCGAAGVGHFFLRLLAPERVRMPVS